MPRPTLMPLLVSLALLLFISTAFAESEVIQTGVASPRDDSEKNNIEILRERAIRNGMDLAVMEVTGIQVSSERADSLATGEKTLIQGKEVREESSIQNHFHTGAMTRSDGHARLVEILREWRKDDQYFVEIKVAVASPDEMVKQKKCGDYWLRAGKPPIAITFEEKDNGKEPGGPDSRTPLFFQDNLTRNGIQLFTGNPADSHYRIYIRQDIQTINMTAYDTITMHCRLSYEIVDQIRNESLAQYRAGNGPQAGFTMEQAKEDCLKPMAPDVSEHLVRALAKILNSQWNNGLERRIVIHGMPGQAVAPVTEILRNLFRVTNASPSRYDAKTFSMNLQYKGSASELARDIQDGPA